jgi:hypothetical protein
MMVGGLNFHHSHKSKEGLKGMTEILESDEVGPADDESIQQAIARRGAISTQQSPSKQENQKLFMRPRPTAEIYKHIEFRGNANAAIRSNTRGAVSAHNSFVKELSLRS